MGYVKTQLPGVNALRQTSNTRRTQPHVHQACAAPTNCASHATELAHLKVTPAPAATADASAVSGQALCNSCSCAIFNGLFDALAFAGHSVSSVDGTISKCAETLWQGLLDTAALPQQTQAFLAACKPGDCVYSAATAAVVATDVDYQAPNCPLSVQQFASSASLRQAVVAACGECGNTATAAAVQHLHIHAHALCIAHSPKFATVA